MNINFFIMFMPSKFFNMTIINILFFIAIIIRVYHYFRGGPRHPIQHHSHHHHPYTSMRQNSRRQHLALWRCLWCGGSPGEECDADSEVVRVILSNITGITTQACMYSFCTRRDYCWIVRDSTWPFDKVSGAAAALASSATLTARRSASSYPPSHASQFKHACQFLVHVGNKPKCPQSRIQPRSVWSADTVKHAEPADLALWRGFWCCGSPCEETGADSEAVRGMVNLCPLSLHSVGAAIILGGHTVESRLRW